LLDPHNPGILLATKVQGEAIMSVRSIGAIVGAWLFVIAMPIATHAQDFPARPIRIVIPYSPGSVADVFARIIAQNMQEQWKGSIVVESKSGANGSIAAEEVARAAPDGYTWLLVTTYFTASPALNTQLEAALATGEVREKLDVAGCEAKSATLSRFGDIVKSDVAVWARVVREAGITAD
jgi:tripartite-type tricarboxylate transporter receptor subunit TctC